VSFARYQRRVAGSIVTPMALTGRGVGLACTVWVGVGVWVGAVVAGVQDVTASTTVNRGARYLKGK
jgi:hypothetical protein